jgi:hypothetical protein
LCLEYYDWHNTVSNIDDDIVIEEKKDEKKASRQKNETRLVGDDLGIITKYDFTQNDWHWCHFNLELFLKKTKYCCN